MQFIARTISVIFHPLFLICYVLALIMVINPYLFSVQDPKMKGLFLISTFILSTFFPLISIGMMRALGLISSLKMEDKKERIGPMIVTSIFYLWLYMNVKDNPGIPGAFSFFVLGATIALFLAFFINNFQKLSLHAVGAGGLLTSILIIGSKFSYGSFVLDLSFLGIYKIQMILLYVIIVIITGAILTSRLLLNAHTKDELYGGFFIGCFSQFIAYLIFF